MAYDYTGPWSSVTGDQADLFWFPDDPASTPFDTSGILSYYNSQSISSEKIALSIPFYGRSFKNTDRIGRKFCGAGTYDLKDLPFRGGCRSAWRLDWLKL
jgi:chitinase